MNRNTIIKYSSAALIVFSLPACNKLNEKAYSLLAPSNYFTTKSDVTAALLGMYKPVQVCCGGYEQARNIMLNAASDEGSAIPPWNQYDVLTYTASSGGEIADLWRVTYQSIGSANFVLDNQDKVEALDPSSDKSFTKASLGEARFMRAVDYFDLVRIYGGVPLRLKQASTSDADLPRTSVDSVYAQLIDDFKYAEQNLPDKNDPGRPTHWAATAYLAKVYLTKKDYVNALAAAQNLIDNGPYGLQPDFAAIFDVNNKNNSEVIFNIQYTRQDGNGSRMEYLCLSPNDFFAGGGNGGWGLMYFQDGSAFYEKYSSGDDRLATTFANASPGLSTYYAGKWKDPAGISVDGHANDYIVYRYADVLLIAAEAENELNGASAAAYDNINEVRSRAKLPDLTAGLTKDQFKDSVLQERALELAFEEERWFDLKRTGRLADALTATGRTWNDRYWLWPVPQSEIQSSNGKITQNAGY